MQHFLGIQFVQGQVFRNLPKEQFYAENFPYNCYKKSVLIKAQRQRRFLNAKFKASP